MRYIEKLKKKVEFEIDPSIKLAEIAAIDFVTIERLMAEGASKGDATKIVNALKRFCAENPKDGVSLRALVMQLHYVPDVGQKWLTYIIAAINTG